jgi:hypothetical protein
MDANEKAVEAEAKAGQWLGAFNELNEAGKAKQAERALGKAQFWLDRANKLRGWA